ncbi:MAG TPA: biotin/lipoate A/B protein ligase family protein, partial [Dehalococcoidia bacterium]|nr:biotin/lipoate A/B protein ligase family protein [Dehalococcoidia bacterium]
LPEADMGACAAAGIDLVRRPTGGRAVLHDGCITYSVTGPADGPVFGGGIRPSYRRIAAALVQAIAILGLREVVPIEPGANAPASPSCFDHAAPYEPVAAGVKLAGSAQARRGQAALQHGSLRLAPGRVPIAALLRPRAGGRGALPGADPPSLGELLGRDVSRDEAARALLAGFEATFGVAFIAGCLSADEQALAARLEQEKYRTPEWTARH